MDKLKPLIVHRFWILFGISLLLPPIAWWMTTGKLAAEIDTRTKRLDEVFSSVPNGQDAPNEDWYNRATDRVSIRKEKNQQALAELWRVQTLTRAWPAAVAKYMAQCPYRGEIADQATRERVPDIYKDEYPSEVWRVWQIPYPKDDRTDPKRPKKIDFPLAVMPRVPVLKWNALPPTWAEIWDAQEDLWLLEQLLGAIERINESSTSLSDAYVKRIDAIELFGGKRVTDGEVGASTSASASSSGGAEAAYDTMMMGMGTRGGATASAGVTSADFSMSEEFTVSSSSNNAGFGSMSMSMANADPNAASGQTNTADTRYITSVEAFRTRGFKLKVIVHQREVLKLMRELLNTKYPVELIRFQQVALSPGLSKGGGAMPNFPGSGFADPTLAHAAGINLGNEGVIAGADDPSLTAIPFDPTGGAASAFPVPGLAHAGSGGAHAVGGAGGLDAGAYNDPHLTQVVVVGLFYIYNEPKLAAPAADGAAPTPTQPTTPSDPAAATAGALDPAATAAPAASVAPSVGTATSDPAASAVPAPTEASPATTPAASTNNPAATSAENPAAPAANPASGSATPVPKGETISPGN